MNVRAQTLAGKNCKDLGLDHQWASEQDVEGKKQTRKRAYDICLVCGKKKRKVCRW